MGIAFFVNGYSVFIRMANFMIAVSSWIKPGCMLPRKMSRLLKNFHILRFVGKVLVGFQDNIFNYCCYILIFYFDVLNQIEEFMCLWSNDKIFRDDYEKRLLPTLDSRQLSRDGRIRNPDEKPLVVVEELVVSEPEPIAKTNVKRPKEGSKEDPKPAPQKDALPVQKVQKETPKTDGKTTSEHIDISDKEISGLENPQRDPSPAEKKVDEAKLKELKREEEIAKAKQAMERKKKLAEKAAAKAAIRAQKEAEKKLKEIISLLR